MSELFGGYTREELDGVRRAVLEAWPAKLMSVFAEFDNDDTFVTLLDQQRLREAQENIPGYESGYLDGYSDAFLSRTREAMSTIRTIRRKLDNARRIRDEYAVCIQRAGEGGWDAAIAHSAQRVADLATKNRELEVMVDVLRKEIVRLQGVAMQQTRKNQQLRGAAFDSFGSSE